MRKDVDYVDCDSDSLLDDREFLTPRRSDGFKKKGLTNNVALYYRQLSHYIFCYLELSFDSQGAYAPKSLPILIWWHESMLDAWDKIEDDDDAD